MLPEENGNLGFKKCEVSPSFHISFGGLNLPYPIMHELMENLPGHMTSRRSPPLDCIADSLPPASCCGESGCKCCCEHWWLRWAPRLSWLFLDMNFPFPLYSEQQEYRKYHKTMKENIQRCFTEEFVKKTNQQRHGSLLLTDLQSLSLCRGPVSKGTSSPLLETRQWC